VPLCVVIRIEKSGIEVIAPIGTGPCTVYLCVSCRVVQGLDLFGSKTSLLDVYMHITTYHIYSGT